MSVLGWREMAAGAVLGRRGVRGCVAVLVVFAAWLGVSAAGAFGFAAGVPWWSLTSGARPAVIVPGVARNEVQLLTVSATGGMYLLEREGVPSALVSWDASAAEMQAILEGVYGPGNVEVPRGEGNELGSDPYEIVFKGELADREVALVETLKEAFFGFELTCKGEPCPGNAVVSEKVLGRADGEVVVTAANLGNGLAQAPVTISDRLPAGLVPVWIKGLAGPNPDTQRGPMECELSSLSCTLTSGTIPPFRSLEMVIGVNVAGAVSGETVGSVSGGGAAEASVSREVAVSDTPAGFGVEDYALQAEDFGGGPDRQAGSHPFQLTTTLSLNQTLLSSKTGGLGYRPEPVGNVKDLHFKWPAGLIGDPSAMARCSTLEFLAEPFPLCKQDTVVGVVRVAIVFTHASQVEHAVVPLYNLEPNKGEPARFAFKTANVNVYIDPSVRTGSDYGVTVSVDNVTQTAATLESQVTVWGVPGDSRHDISRGSGCMTLAAEEPNPGPCSPSEEAHPPALLSMPGSCTGPLASVVEADSWTNPSEVLPFAAAPMPAMDGCNRLPFNPSIEVKPDVPAASTSTGLAVNVHVPQEETLNAAGLAEARRVRTSPSPSPKAWPSTPPAPTGCSCSRTARGVHRLRRTAVAAGRADRAVHRNAPEPPAPGVNFCPDASKIGTVKIKSPMLREPARRRPCISRRRTRTRSTRCSRCTSSREDHESGVLVKLPGEVSLDPNTGQLMATFQNTPQAPFEDAEIHFFGGERAPLPTPDPLRHLHHQRDVHPVVGDHAGHLARRSSRSRSGPNGGPCPRAALPFTPSLAAGSPNINAGSFSPLTTTIGREDGNQNMQQSAAAHGPGHVGHPRRRDAVPRSRRPTQAPAIRSKPDR